MLKMDLKIASLAMSYMVTEDKVRRLASEIAGYPEDFMVPCDTGIRLSGAYYEMRPYEDLEDYIEDINSYVKEARAEGAQILVFPRLMGMMPVTFMPNFKKIEKELSSLLKESGSERNAFYAFTEATQGFLGEIFFNTFATMAKYHKMIIAAGGFYHITDGKIYNTVYLFGEDGKLIGRHDKLFLNEKEKSWGVTAGTEISVCRSSLGKIALLATGDDSRYEPYFIANTMGAHICASVSGPGDSEQMGLVHRANENRMCIVTGGFDSSILGGSLAFKEKAMAAVPYPLSLKKDGILRRGDKKVNTCMVNIKKLRDSFDNYSADLNGEFLKEMLK